MDERAKTRYYVVSAWAMDDLEPSIDAAAKDIEDNLAGRVVREIVLPRGMDADDPARFAVVLVFEAEEPDGRGAS